MPVAHILHRARAHNVSAIGHSIQIVRKIIATEQFRSSGLTTAEMYRLALAEPPPENFEKYEGPSETAIQYTKSRERKVPPPLPPHPEHPVRSMLFLKSQVLPVLEGLREIRKATGKRFTTVVEDVQAQSVGKSRDGKGKGKGKVESASIATEPSAPEIPVSHNVHLWMPGLHQKPSVDLPGDDAQCGDTFDHLNKRRRRERKLKVERESHRKIQVRAAANKERKRLAWEAYMRKATLKSVKDFSPSENTSEQEQVAQA